MLTAVRWYRVMSFGRPRGPWRDTKEAARRDAINLGLGAYDEWGHWYDIVPGRIQQTFVIEDQAAA